MIELLAPARDADIAIEAILSGADAVYIGAPSHGARQAASNSIADIARVVEVAHRYNARVYATVNTVIFDDEIPDVEKLIRELYRAGVDALIVQDMAVLRMNIPPVDLHASTQCDIRDAGRARFLRSVGFSRVVLARELSEKKLPESTARCPPWNSRRSATAPFALATAATAGQVSSLPDAAPTAASAPRSAAWLST